MGIRLMSACLQSDTTHPIGQLVGLARSDLAYATTEVRRRLDALGVGPFRGMAVSQDVIMVSAESCGTHSRKVQFDSNGWCGFSFCLSGWCVFDYPSRSARYCPGTQVFYNGGSQTFALQRGTPILSVGVSGSPAALADFLGLTAGDLSQIIQCGVARQGNLALPTAGTEQLRRSAARLAENLRQDGKDRFGSLRARATAMDFGLYMLESMDRLQNGFREASAHSLSVRRRVEDGAARLEKQTRPTERIGTMAARLGFSRSAFDQAFRARFGRSPGTFRIEARLQKVARALQSGDAPITSLAMEFGFSSPSNLTRCFRSRYGMPPTAYRKRYRG